MCGASAVLNQIAKLVIKIEVMYVVVHHVIHEQKLHLSDDTLKSFPCWCILFQCNYFDSKSIKIIRTAMLPLKNGISGNLRTFSSWKTKKLGNCQSPGKHIFLGI